MSERREIQMPETRELFEGLEVAEAVRVGDTVYVSGQVGWDQNLQPVAGLEAQARLAFDHLKAVLEKAGAKPHHITHLQLFFVDTGQGTVMRTARNSEGKIGRFLRLLEVVH